MLSLATLDSGDRVLDMNAREGQLLEYLSRFIKCEICGVSGSMADVKHTRAKLKNADILYTGSEDIPWRENSFDAVFWQTEYHAKSDIKLKEALRVLKPGGQLLLGIVGYPTPRWQTARLFTNDLETPRSLFLTNKSSWFQLLADIGFHPIGWRSIYFTSKVVIGQKPITQDLEMNG